MGPSGSGKSTVVLQHALLNGLDFLAEDSVLVELAGLRATGVASFVHLRRDALRFLTARQRAALLHRAAPIRRRSGVEKFEIDLRRPGYRLAAGAVADSGRGILLAAQRRQTNSADAPADGNCARSARRPAALRLPAAGLERLPQADVTTAGCMSCVAGVTHARRSKALRELLAGS